MQSYIEIQTFEMGKCNVRGMGGIVEEKMKFIPGSIYLPRKHFPTKQKYPQEREAQNERPKNTVITEEKQTNT
jgi:hypothetical protein